jgi:hypothetical protein
MNDCARESGVKSGSGSLDLSTISQSYVRVSITGIRRWTYEDLYSIDFDRDLAG